MFRPPYANGRHSIEVGAVGWVDCVPGPVVAKRNIHSFSRNFGSSCPFFAMAIIGSTKIIGEAPPIPSRPPNDQR